MPGGRGGALARSSASISFEQIGHFAVMRLWRQNSDVMAPPAHASGTTRPPRDGVSVTPRRRIRSPCRAVGPELEAARHGAQHLVQLHRRERGAGAAAHAAAERQPGVRRGGAVEEALGPEGGRVRPQLGAAVREVDARRHVDAGRQRPAAERERLGDLARRDRQHRPDPQHLLDGRVEVLVAAVAQARGDARVAGEPLERPRERARRSSRGRRRAASRPGRAARRRSRRRR